MELRLKIGRYAGEIKDVAPEIARQLLDDGNATDPRFEGEVPPPQAAQVEEVPAELPRVRKSRRS